MVQTLNLTSREIRKELLKLPLMKKRNLWLTDMEYTLPAILELKRAVADCSVSGLPYKKNKMECEEFALFLMADIRRMHLYDSTLKLNWAFGIARGYLDTLFDGRMVHDNNICLTEDGVWIIDPMTDEIMKFEEEIFNPFFVRL